MLAAWVIFMPANSFMLAMLPNVKGLRRRFWRPFDGGRVRDAHGHGARVVVLAVVAVVGLVSQRQGRREAGAVALAPVTDLVAAPPHLRRGVGEVLDAREGPGAPPVVGVGHVV